MKKEWLPPVLMVLCLSITESGKPSGASMEVNFPVCAQMGVNES
ncbi:MAG: hypothetical protein P1U40_05695 [Coxiellaceae bacterium]|nr:hypothetical protein [Coxiellaceae bacterium]